MTLTVQRPQSVDTFLAAAGDFLAEREAEHNLLFGMCSTLRTIYGAIGYEPVCDVDEYRFAADA